MFLCAVILRVSAEEEIKRGARNEKKNTSGSSFAPQSKCSSDWQTSLSVSADTASNLTVLRHPELPLNMINVE